MGQGRRPDVDSLAALVQWSGLSSDAFMSGKRQQTAQPLAMISTYLRGDPNLSDTSAHLLEEIVKTAYEQLRER